MKLGRFGECGNDVSEHAFQAERGGPWTKSENHDTSGPIGPRLATRDEVADRRALDLRLGCDGVRRQTSVAA